MYIEQNNQHRGWVIRGIIFTAFIVVVYKLILHKPGMKIEKTEKYSISNVVDSSKVEPRTVSSSDIMGQNGNPENLEAVKDTLKEPKGTVISVKSKVESPTTQKTTNIVENAKELEFEPKIKTLTNCANKSFESKIYQRGKYWVLQNYIRANHGELRCTESVTFATHADYKNLNYLTPILERWLGPVSISLYTSEADLEQTIDSIKYLRQCVSQSFIVRKFATFHIFLDSFHFPENIPRSDEVLNGTIDCSIPPPYLSRTDESLPKIQPTYPVNVARNIAREAALTHFSIVCDIDFLPSPEIPRKFLEMIARNEATYLKKPKVFLLATFQVGASSKVPWTKTELRGLLRDRKLIPLYTKNCSTIDCRKLPTTDEWITADDIDGLHVLNTKGNGDGYFWEHFFIGTNNEPNFDENLDEEFGKLTQIRIMFLLKYEFMVLDNAFLVHKVD